MGIFLFIAIHLAFFSYFATKYNEAVGKIAKVKFSWKVKKKVSKKSQEIIKSLEQKAIRYKRYAIVSCLVIFLCHLFYSMVNLFPDHWSYLVPLITFGAYLLLYLLLFWMKGASVIQSTEADSFGSGTTGMMGHNPFR